MMAISHVTIGTVGWATFAVYTGQPLQPETFSAAVLGSLAPDIDYPRSWIGRNLPFISRPLAKLVSHRGITHSSFALIAGGLLLYQWGYFAEGLLAAFLIGYLLHLLADWLTITGIPLLWPLRKRFKSPLRIRTGGMLEIYVVVLIIIGMLSAAGAIAAYPSC
ncbi:membrane-bound metal-dependent hydrolase YdjM [Halorhodospira halochloris]|uniref:Membrane-bound metal-dependent hydrolase YdjM n=1 Tax=Halorhodospira halochloris TaxID=1052 RepID=A0A120MZF0_HALHR|nr:metal-dependent hydrolase [Halorhodospira halochloris]MBK1652244.1 hypothetical protein [Halorhodospira halochloris]BAU56966.1 membrane-bound metal-dependent hydrolase YdjM [Halorhodospira halochloris]